MWIRDSNAGISARRAPGRLGRRMLQIWPVRSTNNRLAALRWADVDLGAITANCSRIVAHLPEGSRLFGVVKAGGYGHGAIPAATAALKGGAGGRYGAVAV